MKNRIIAVVVTLLLICAVLCSCQNNVYGKLNKLAGNSYDGVKLTITTDVNSVELVSEYETKKVDKNNAEVVYSFQELNPISENNIPQEYVTTHYGSMTVQLSGRNAIVSQNGAETKLNVRQITANKLNFDQNNFSDVVDEEGKFSATILDLSKFLRTTVDGTNATVSVIYTEQALVSLTINYVSAKDAYITATYVFS